MSDSSICPANWTREYRCKQDKFDPLPDFVVGLPNVTTGVNQCAFVNPDSPHCDPGSIVKTFQIMAELFHRRLVIKRYTSTLNGGPNETQNSGMNLLAAGKFDTISFSTFLTKERDEVAISAPPFGYKVIAATIQKPPQFSTSTYNVFTLIDIYIVLALAFCLLSLLALKMLVAKYGQGQYFRRTVVTVASSLIYGMFLVGIIEELYANSLSIEIYRSPSPDLPFRTYSELIEKTRTKQMIPLVSPSGTTTIFYDTLRAAGISNPEYYSKNVASPEEAIALIKQDKRYFFIKSEPLMMPYWITYCNDILGVVHESFPSNAYGFYFHPKKPSSIRELLNYTTLAILDKHYKRFETQENKELERKTQCSPDFKVSWRAIELAHFYMIFIIIPIGGAIAATMLLVEIIWNNQMRIKSTEEADKPLCIHQTNDSLQ